MPAFAFNWVSRSALQDPINEPASHAKLARSSTLNNRPGDVAKALPALNLYALSN